jgi:hypothetical protein
MPPIDFIYLNHQAVRLTSFTREPESSRLSLVVIVRGNPARDELNALIASEPILVAFPDEEPAGMHVAAIDLKTTGEGARSIHRFDLKLVPWASQDDTGPRPDDATEPGSVRELIRRLDAIERKLDQVIARLSDHRD